MSPRTRVICISQSINQSIKQKAPSHSINQSIHNLLLIFIDSADQSINQSTYQSWDISSIPNQSINQGTCISKSVFSLNCRGLQVLMVFCIVLDDEKSHETILFSKFFLIIWMMVFFTNLFHHLKPVAKCVSFQVVVAHDFPDDDAVPDIYLLYRPGHYDILYRNPLWIECVGGGGRERFFCNSVSKFQSGNFYLFRKSAIPAHNYLCFFWLLTFFHELNPC